MPRHLLPLSWEKHSSIVGQHSGPAAPKTCAALSCCDLGKLLKALSWSDLICKLGKVVSPARAAASKVQRLGLGQGPGAPRPST